MDKVTCPICTRKFKEINKSHLNSHNLTVMQYDKLYPDFPRMTMEHRRTKNRYQNITPEMSLKLKKSHTLQGYKDKYGDDIGHIRWLESKINKSMSKTLDRYIERHGEVVGTKKYDEYQKMNKTKMTESGFIKRYGEEDGLKRFNQWVITNKASKTKKHYIHKYGMEEGTIRWDLKNYRNSKSSMIVPMDQRLDFEVYRLVVNRMTKNTIRKKNIHNIQLVKKGEWSLDHRFSICEGFRQRIPPYVISSEHNLEVITHTSNCSKGRQCSITLPELFDLIF